MTAQPSPSFSSNIQLPNAYTTTSAAPPQSPSLPITPQLPITFLLHKPPAVKHLLYSITASLHLPNASLPISIPPSPHLPAFQVPVRKHLHHDVSSYPLPSQYRPPHEHSTFCSPSSLSDPRPSSASTTTSTNGRSFSSPSSSPPDTASPPSASEGAPAFSRMAWGVNRVWGQVHISRSSNKCKHGLPLICMPLPSAVWPGV